MTKKNNETYRTRCAYCGNLLYDKNGKRLRGGEEGWKSNNIYCGKCRYEGLDNVHRLTGRSNGWDRR